MEKKLRPTEFSFKGKRLEITPLESGSWSIKIDGIEVNNMTESLTLSMKGEANIVEVKLNLIEVN